MQIPRAARQMARLTAIKYACHLEQTLVQGLLLIHQLERLSSLLINDTAVGLSSSVKSSSSQIAVPEACPSGIAAEVAKAQSASGKHDRAMQGTHFTAQPCLPRRPPVRGCLSSISPVPILSASSLPSSSLPAPHPNCKLSRS